MSIPPRTAQNVGGDCVWRVELGVWKVNGRTAAFNYELYNYGETLSFIRPTIT